MPDLQSERISGGLVARYAIDVPAEPGWAQPAMHRADAVGGAVERDDAGAGGGWQPAEWDPPIPQEAGGDWGDGSYTTGNDDDHRGRRSHRGDKGRGQYRPAQHTPDRDDMAGRGRHGRAGLDFAGAGGAAHGGLAATGVSEPWANAPVSRRRADGKLVANPGGLRLGSTYTPVGDRHRQGLHMNRPFLRFVRLYVPTVERSSPYPGGRTSPYDPIARANRQGPIEPRLRRLQRPYGQADYADVDQAPAGRPMYDAGVVEQDWVR